MQARLEEIPELAGKVVVFRRADIESQFNARMGKTRGRCVVIRTVSAKNESKTDTSQFVALYTVSLFTTPSLTQKDAKHADDLLAEIEHKLNKWWPASLPSNRRMMLRSGEITFPEAPDYDIAQLTFRSPPVPLEAVSAGYDNWENLNTRWENIGN